MVGRLSSCDCVHRRPASRRGWQTRVSCFLLLPPTADRRPLDPLGRTLRPAGHGWARAV